MRTRLSWMALLLLPGTLACGGGGGGGGVVPGGGGSMTATFVPATSSPGPKSSVMGLGNVAGELVTVTVNLTDVSNVYGAAFSVTYDPARVSFHGSSAGTILETGGHTPTYQVTAAQAGTVVVGATRNGNVAGVNVSGTKTLVRLTFQVNVEGDTPLQFSAPELYDGAVPPQPIAGVTWSAGVLSAQ